MQRVSWAALSGNTPARKWGKKDWEGDDPGMGQPLKRGLGWTVWYALHPVRLVDLTCVFSLPIPLPVSKVLKTSLESDYAEFKRSSTGFPGKLSETKKEYEIWKF